jgi:hypothetical protein
VNLPSALVVSGDPVPAAAAAFPGWTVLSGELPEEPFDLAGEGVVWATTLCRAEDRQKILLAAIRGAAVVVALTIDASDGRQFLDDLRRAADVRTVLDSRPPAALGKDHTALLAAMADGCSLDQAAARLCVSRRTAARRLAEARSSLHTPTTVEAIHLARELGLLV